VERLKRIEEEANRKLEAAIMEEQEKLAAAISRRIDKFRPHPHDSSDNSHVQ
jgi:hypothetical protein